MKGITPMHMEPVKDAMGRLLAEHPINPFGELLRDLFDPWMDQKKRADQYLLSIGITTAVIDEVAVMVSEEDEYLDLIRAFLDHPDYTAFNHAFDRVSTSPIKGQYSVEYTFFEGPKELGMRVEAMRLMSGYSPIHSGLKEVLGSRHIPGVAPVHLSFKVNSKAEYQETLKKLAEAGAVMVQGCQSTYGEFSYFSTTAGEGLGMYLKPRVNLRDGESVVGEGSPTLGRAYREHSFENVRTNARTNLPPRPIRDEPQA